MAVVEETEERLLKLQLRLAQLEMKEKSQNDFLTFVKHVWPEFIAGQHHRIIAEKLERVAKGDIKEIILALSTTMEGDTTNFYIYKKLSKYPVKITTLARGVAVGDELEYADEITLGRSIVNRTLFASTLAEKKQDQDE